VLNGSDEPVIITEGYKACLWIIQAGWTQTVALMGSFLTQIQRSILDRMGGNELVLFLDNDAAGIAATERIGKSLKRSAKVTIAEYQPWAKQPDDFNKAGLQHALDNRKGFWKWVSTRPG